LPDQPEFQGHHTKQAYHKLGLCPQKTPKGKEPRLTGRLFGLLNPAAALFQVYVCLECHRWQNEQSDEKLLLAFYIIMAVDVVDENIHIICHYGFELLKKMSYYSTKDKAYEGNLENAS